MKNLLYLLVFLFSITSFAQGEANVWYFGHNAGLDFNAIPPAALTDGQIDTFEGCSSFSDPSGNLLFYSDGTTVWNTNHVPMPNGTGLFGDSSSSQSAMIIPKPGSTTIYYIFTVDAPSSQAPYSGFNYYELDMTLDGGLGDISGGPFDLNGSKNTQFWSEKVAAVKGKDCEEFWVVSYIYDPVTPPGLPEFFAYKVTATGVSTTPVRSTISYASSDFRGYLKISPDGSKIGIAHMQVGGFLVYDFDDATGMVSNELNLQMPNISGVSSSLQPNQPYGVEFSPNSEKVYVHASNGGPFGDSSVGAHYSSLIQFDVSLPTNADIINSRQIVDARNMYRGALQLGPDHKIYRSISQSYQVGTPFLGVIESPNEAGTAANYQHNAVSLNGQDSSQGLPPFIASIFSSILLTADDGMGNTTVINDQVFDMCTGDNLNITPEVLTGSIAYKWYLDSNPIPFSTTPNLLFTNVTPADNGVYKLVAEHTDTCGNSNTLEGEFTISVSDYSIANPAQNLIVCDDDNDGTYLFDLTQNDAVIIDTQAGMEVLYFDSQVNADDNTSPLSSPYNSGNATIYARIHPIGNNNCYDTTSFDLELYDSAFPTDVTTMTPLELCDDTSIGTLNDGLAITDITAKETEILNGQSAAGFTITYFTDAGFLNQITTPNTFDNTGFAGGLTVHVQMTNNLNATCFATTAFDLIIYEQPVANIAPTMILCDDDNNGTMPFVLTDQDSFINTVTGMSITYHPTQADADTSSTSNAISSPFESGNATIYARVENDLSPTSCYDTSSFDIEVYESAFPLDAANISPIENCDNTSVGTDTDGFILFDLTQNETDILNGQSATDFTLTYFTDAGYSIPISTPSNSFQNTIIGGQTIYVRMTNNLESSCYADTEFEIEVFELPTILDSYLFKNCDEDGTPDGFTDYNLDEANEFITLGNTSLSVTYYLSFANADTGTSPISPSPFNNATQNIVYARIETTDGCHRVSTITLQVSTTSFPVGYNKILSSCDDDETIDGLHLFDLSLASPDLVAQFPTGQNLTVHYYRTLTDAQLEIDEIVSQTDYMSENPFSQIIYVRVESGDNGDCFGLGGNLTLVVNPRPEFEVDPEAIVCLNLPPITLETYNPDDVYTYEWTDENGVVISSNPTAQVSEGGTYTVIATSTDGNNCESFPHEVVVSESIIASIDEDDVTITDDSDNNTITINNDLNNLGIGDYEFALDDINGPYQDDPFFDNVAPGIHTIFVQDKNSCGIAQLIVAVIGFPKFFTPNNDSENDTWQVKGVSDGFFVNSTIYIFDRFGKIVANVDATGDGWDGYYNGKTLPSDDYWFTAELIDQNGNIRSRKGHFSLIRR